MDKLTARTAEYLMNFDPQEVFPLSIDVVELADEDLEKVSGSCFGCGWGGGFFPVWGGFFPVWGGGFFPGFWGGGFGFSSFSGAFGGW